MLFYVIEKRKKNVYCDFFILLVDKKSKNNDNEGTLGE